MLPTSSRPPMADVKFIIAFTSFIIFTALPFCQCLSSHDVESIPRDSSAAINPDAMVYHARRSFAEMIDGVDGLHVVKMYHRGMKQADSNTANTANGDVAILASDSKPDGSDQKLERFESLRTFGDVRSEARSRNRAKEATQKGTSDGSTAGVADANLSPDDVFHSKYLHWLMWRDRKRAKSVQSNDNGRSRGVRAGQWKGAGMEDDRDEEHESVNRELEKSRRRARRLGATSTMGLLGATYPNGAYYVQLGLGSPPQPFNLDVDTGSNLLWLNCLPCNPCTTSSSLQTNAPFDPSQSSSAHALQCTDPRCRFPDKTVKILNCMGPRGAGAGNTTSAAGPGGGGSSALPASAASCDYSVAYSDGSGSSGRLLSDVLHLPVTGSLSMAGIPVTFGCGNSQQGNFYNGPVWTFYQPLDGLLGLGRGSISLMAELQGERERGGKDALEPMVSHCLGGASGGGWLTIGRIPIPAIASSTHMKPDNTFYKVSLMKVFVGGREVAVNPAQYGNVTAGNAIFDSGTTFTILPGTFIAPILGLIQQAVGLSPAHYSMGNSGSLCFAANMELSQDAIKARFPSINLQFYGRTTFMNIPPQTYTYFVTDGMNQLVCTQLLPGADVAKTPNGIAFILGAVWMRDYLISMDHGAGIISWTPTKCT